MLRSTILLIIGVALSAPATAAAQTELKLDLSRSGSSPTVTSQTGADLSRAISLKPSESFVVEMSCTAPVKCGEVNLRLRSDERPRGEAPTALTRSDTAARGEFTPDLFADRTNLELEVVEGSAVVSTISLVVVAAANGPERRNTGGTAASESSPLSRLVAYDCSIELNAARESLGAATYRERENTAHFLVAANGNVWHRPAINLVDENDMVEVWVVAHPALIPALKVRRTSAFRVPGVLSIVGQDATVPDAFGRKSAAPGAAREKCADIKLRISDFQPGRGEITLSAVTDKGDVSTGSVELGVNTLYAGAFALGAIRTELRDPTFGLVTNGTASVISEVQDSGLRTLYTLTYTPFLWGRRDLEKEPPLLDLRRLNPMFGIVLSDIQNNAVLGLSYDLVSAVYLSGGVHFGRVLRLNPDAGYAVGDAFTGTSAEIPTTREWRQRPFLGVALDLRAASQFVTKAVGSGTK